MVDEMWKKAKDLFGDDIDNAPEDEARKRIEKTFSGIDSKELGILNAVFGSEFKKTDEVLEGLRKRMEVFVSAASGLTAVAAGATVFYFSPAIDAVQDVVADQLKYFLHKVHGPIRLPDDIYQKAETITRTTQGLVSMIITHPIFNVIYKITGIGYVAATHRNDIKKSVLYGIVKNASESELLNRYSR